MNTTMDFFITATELLGVVSFAISGTMTGLKKGLDVFGSCILAITTALGGGILRDLLLGLTPPSTLANPMYMLVCIGVSVIITLLPSLRRFLKHNPKHYDFLMLLSDSIGLAIFTVHGLAMAESAGFGENAFLVIFVALITGIGGGVMRDMFVGDKPYVFVKHIYALAALAGAIVCKVLYAPLGQNAAMLAGFFVILAIRMCAAHFRWSLPKPKDV